MPMLTTNTVATLPQLPLRIHDDFLHYFNGKRRSLKIAEPGWLGYNIHNMDENVEQKPPKINIKQMDRKIKIAEFSLEDLKLSHLLVSPTSQGSSGKQSARWKNCLCTLTTHPESFQCLHQRNPSLPQGEKPEVGSLELLPIDLLQAHQGCLHIVGSYGQNRLVTRSECTNKLLPMSFNLL
uniref:Uncharacterized protein n=1 Tax=Quercus lobata TaxID=97700 RepID=A0A7N2M8E1_QUELO